MTETLAPSPLANLRDFGGLPVAGGRVRSRTLWRADDICVAPAWQLAELAAAGLRTVIDLRSHGELKRTGRGPAADHGIVHYHLPLTEHSADPVALAELFAATPTAAQVGVWYAGLFRRQAPRLVQALGLIADADGGVLFHCAAGKDRTGILAAAVLAAIGATSETIVADYAATHPNIEAVLTRLSATRSAVSAGGLLLTDLAGHPMLGAEAASMTGMLAELANEGGPIAVLRAAGYDHSLAARLRGRLVGAGATR